MTRGNNCAWPLDDEGESARCRGTRWFQFRWKKTTNRSATGRQRLGDQDLLEVGSD